MAELNRTLIQSLRLSSFRNYEQESAELSSNHNLLIGANGEGKSNFLEAIHLLSTTRSFRRSKDREMVKFGASSANVCAATVSFSVELTIPAHGRRVARINEALVPKVSDLIGRLPSVCFSTCDMQIVRGEPADRRRYLDIELSQIRPRYLESFASYRTALMHRNALLKAIRAEGQSQTSLGVWNDKLAEAGETIRDLRMEFVAELGPIANEFHALLTNGRETVRLEYEPGSGFARLPIRDQLQASLSADLAAGHTTVGPHRDDLKIEVGGYDARSFASQGQQRTAVLAVKLAQVEYWKRFHKTIPILLLDDIFSDLDSQRREQVLEVSGAMGQVIITATDIHAVEAEINAAAKVINVKSGKLS